MSFITWIFNAIKWLIGLAKPENLRHIAHLGGPEWVGYLILFAIIFSETGLLVGFFLPGDSLLFAAGLLSSPSAGRVFHIVPLALLLIVAAILGDAVNYWFGLTMEEKVFEKGRLRFIKHEHLMAAKEFYERHGGKAIIMARFVPLVRTFTPFVAGVARMGYRRFALYNILGGVGWVCSMTLAGYWLGGFQVVKDHFEKIVIGIVVISVMPIVIAAFRRGRNRRPAVSDVAPGGAIDPANPYATAGRPLLADRDPQQDDAH